MLLQRYFDVSQAPDVESLEKRLVRFAQDMDFGIVNAMMVFDSPGPAKRPRVVGIGNIPGAYVEAFNSFPDTARDPVMHRLKTLSVPFVYDQDLYAAEGAADLWDAQAPFGYRTGVAVALHLPGYRHFMLGVDREAPLPDGTDQLTRMMADLQLLAVHAQAAAGRLLATDHGGDASVPVLTERELEILRWTMDGKSAWSVGAILGVSEHTVNFHLRNVFKKLGASSKHQAVLKALQFGLL